MSTNVTVFGLGCTPLSGFSSQYLSYLKSKGYPLPRILYLSPNSAPIGATVPETNSKKIAAQGTSRLVLVEGVGTLFRALPSLQAADRVVVADTPILLSEIPGLASLDWSAPESWRFLIKRIDIPRFHLQLKRSKANGVDVRALTWKRLDQLGLLIEDTSTGAMLQPIKAAMAQLDFKHHAPFRKLIADWLTGRKKPSDLVQFLNTTIPAGALSSQITGALQSAAVKNQDVLRRSIAALRANKSFNSIIKDKDVTPFEVRYLAKMTTVKKESA